MIEDQDLQSVWKVKSSFTVSSVQPPTWSQDVRQSEQPVTRLEVFFFITSDDWQIYFRIFDVTYV